MYKIGIWFNKQDYEYDVHSLMMAFYPGSEISLLYGETLAEEQFEPLIYNTAMKVEYKEGQIGLTAFQDGEIYYESAAVESYEDRKETKNRLKQAVYRVLSKITGKVLPWGTLTGIRPTKLPMQMLEQGMKNVDIARYLRDTYYTSNEKTALSIAIANREREILKDIDYENGYSLYVGIPFCPSICLYCSFSSYPLERWKKRVDEYVDTLCYEIRKTGDFMAGRKLNTIYIGGGTPTTLSPRQLRRVLTCLGEVFSYDDLQEFTVEAGRPDSITREKLQVLREFPVTRISVNPQTMNQETLEIIGRRHTVEDTKEAFLLARELGFDNINMDLIVGLPGEDKEMVRHTLEEVKALNPDSLTVHSLAVKRAARLHMFRDQYQEMTFENSQEIMDMTMEYAHEMEMGPYYLYRQKNMAGNFENVGYSREGKAGIYNILIMEEKQPILALGAGGSTKLVFDHGRRIERVENVKDVTNYLQRIDEMIERKRVGIEKYLGMPKKKEDSQDGDSGESAPGEIVLDLTNEMNHAIQVSNFAYEVGRELKLDEETCHELALAGMLHDIGKIKLNRYINGVEDPMAIEKLKYDRMHSQLGYEALKDQGYSRFILDCILYHHENYDGSGYPCNLRGEDIPFGARIMHVCDVYVALRSDRPYRSAFDVNTAMELMIEEVKNFDMEVFLAFQRVVHNKLSEE